MQHTKSQNANSKQKEDKIFNVKKNCLNLNMVHFHIAVQQFAFCKMVIELIRMALFKIGSSPQLSLHLTVFKQSMTFLNWSYLVNDLCHW